MRFVIVLIFIISTTYAGAILGAALFIAVDAITYVWCLLSSGFDFAVAKTNFAILTGHFGSMPDAAKAGAVCPGLLLGFWGGWHAIVKRVNPFVYIWKRTDK